MGEDNYASYLAATVLVENKPVTYRLLSRALNVNVNVAKMMLFDFHQKQNAKKPRSVYATYLLTGAKRSDKDSNVMNGRAGEDAIMHSSPFMSSMENAEKDTELNVKNMAIVLVREEELEKTHAEFEDGTSIHIYSLQPYPIENLNILSTCNHDSTMEHADELPMERWRNYGSIRNPYIKRRTAKYAPPIAVPTSRAVTKSTTKPSVNVSDNSAPIQNGSGKEDESSLKSTQVPSAAGANMLKRSESKSGVKRDKAAGDIFKSFAKAKSKPAEAMRKPEPTPVAADDSIMEGMSEVLHLSLLHPQIKFDDDKNTAARRAREDRAEKLRKMMEDDDEELPDAPSPNELQPIPSPVISKAATPEPSESEARVVVQNGRRRGRRRVMKKKKVKDEEGYLVTKEEAVWESFSEEEPDHKKLKPTISKAGSTVKGKTTGKKGQGSIASFFKKA